MIDLQKLINFDEKLLLQLNGSESLFFDGLFSVYTTLYIWLPLGITFLYVILKNNSWKSILLIFAMVAMVLVLTDQVSSGICKPFFQRFRPTNDPQLMYAVDVVNNYRGGRYGFISGHATNSFGIVVFAVMLLKNRALTWSMLLWALLNSFSRIYLGVHYPGDIVAGIIAGVAIGFLVYGIYRLIYKKLDFKRHSWISGNYTKSGYLITDIQFLLFVLYFTFALIPILSIYYVKYIQ